MVMSLPSLKLFSDMDNKPEIHTDTERTKIIQDELNDIKKMM